MSPSHASVVIMLIIRQGTGVTADLSWGTVKENVLTFFFFNYYIWASQIQTLSVTHLNSDVTLLLCCRHSGRHYAGRVNPEGFQGPAAGLGPSNRLAAGAEMYFIGIAFWPFSQFNPMKAQSRNNFTVRWHSQHFEKQILEQSRTLIYWLISPSSCFG